MTSPRALAVDLLVRIDGGAFAHALVPSALRAAALEPRDAAFVTDLVSGTVRLRGALDFLVARVADRPISDLDPRVRAGLRLGTYQIVRGTPAHAAVTETVEAVGGRGRGYVNAVLRKVTALGPPWPWPQGGTPADVAVRTSHPVWMVELLHADLGAEATEAMLRADNDPPSLTLRPNPRRSSPAEIERELAAAGATVARGALVADAVIVRGGGDPATMPAVVEGRATPQDEASQAVAALVAAVSGERVLEVGAAPGGKATALAERGASTTAVDIDGNRLGMVVAAAQRLGLDVAAIVADGRALPARGVFDRVLVDAPCSGLGVLRRRPDARWNVRPETIPILAELQRELLAEAAEVVAPGGLLVYSVCTLSAAETVEIDEWAARELGHFEPVTAPGPPWSAIGRGARLLPQTRGTDGMYLLLLRRRHGPTGTVA